MPSNEAYLAAVQLRVAAVTGAWNQIDLPVGARDALFTLDDETATWRLSTSNAIPVTTGTYIAATGGVTFRGTAAAVTSVFVNPGSNTTVQVLYQVES
jgi:hypothetical protein